MSDGIAGRQVVGIDLHLHRSVIGRIDEQGNELGWERIDNDPSALVAECRKAGRGAPVTIEATYGWYWAVDALLAAGFEVHLAHPLGMKALHKRSGSRPTRATRTSWRTCCGWAHCRRPTSRRRTCASCGNWSGTAASW